MIGTGKDDILYRINADISEETRNLAEGGRQFELFGARAKRSLANLTRDVGALGKRISGLSAAATALVGGYTLHKIFGVGQYLPIDKALLRIQANLGASVRQVKGLQDGLEGLSLKHGDNPTEVFSKAADLSAYLKPDEIMTVMSAGVGAAKATGQNLGEVVDRIFQMNKLFGLGVDKSKEIADNFVASRLEAEDLDKVLERGVLKGLAAGNYEQVLAMLGGLKRAGVANDPRAITGMEAIWNAVRTRQKPLLDAGINPKGKSVIQVLEAMDAANKRFIASGKYTREQLVDSMSKGFKVPGGGEGIEFLIAHLDDMTVSQDNLAHSAEIAGRLEETMSKSWETQLGRVDAAVRTISVDLSAVYDKARDFFRILGEHPDAIKAGVLGVGALSAASIALIAATKGRAALGGLGKVAATGLGSAAGVVEGLTAKKLTGGDVVPVWVVNIGQMGSAAGPAAIGLGQRALKYGGYALGALTSPVAIAIGSAALMAGLSYELSKMTPQESARDCEPGSRHTCLAGPPSGECRLLAGGGNGRPQQHNTQLGHGRRPPYREIERSEHGSPSQRERP